MEEGGRIMLEGCVSRGDVFCHWMLIGGVK